MPDVSSSFFDLSGKRALVTGAASGIGAAVAARYQAAGAEVILSDIHDELTVDIGSSNYIKLDVADEECHKAAAKAIAPGKLDILVNNAGVAFDEGLLESSNLDLFRKTIEINLMGVAFALKHLAPCVGDGGSIINTASAAASSGIPGYGSYAASKAGVVGLSRVAAMELGARGICVNAICPGTVATPMEPDDSAEAQFTAKASALGRIAQTDDLVGLYHFLASSESKYITGQAIYVDGGISAGFPDGMLSS